MEFHVLSIFPEMFESVFEHSIPRIAQEKGSLKIFQYDLRDWATDKHHKVDDVPFGGGPGMVIRCDCTFAAIEDIEKRCGDSLRKILLTPSGQPMNQAYVRELSSAEKVLLICGRYEGFDERILEGLELEELSIGDYVLSGGEIAAMTVIDAVSRLLPGVLGDAESAERESFENGLLDFPVYTRPRVFHGMEVPEVLTSGHHEKIEEWRREQSLLRTQQRRADLLPETESDAQADGPEE